MNAESAGAGAIEAPDREGRSGWIRRASDAVPFERIEAYFAGRAYEPHRHDTYAIGRTLSGVQSFHYRNGFRSSVPGGTMVLHPDELHDGQSGAKGGFHYRMIYLEPAVLQGALGGRPLPFITDGISRDPRLFAATDVLMQGIEHRIDTLEYEDAIYDLAQALEAAGDGRVARGPVLADYRSAERARAYLNDLSGESVSLGLLEGISGRNRWSLSRDFRLLFGTSPHRYLVMRRLDAVKRALRPGVSLADVAIGAGFADQSHMTRHFTKTFGVSPARWVRMLVA